MKADYAEHVGKRDWPVDILCVGFAVLLAWSVCEVASAIAIHSESQKELADYRDAAAIRYEARTQRMIERIEREYKKARGE